MSSYPMFQEIINEMQARPEADPSSSPSINSGHGSGRGPAGILEEYVSPLLDVCNEINEWIGQYPTWDFTNEPPWYNKFICELARFDVDLTPIWREARAEAALRGASGQAEEEAQE